MSHLRISVTFMISLAVAVVAAKAEPTANPLLAVDQNRAAVVERIVGEWGGELARSSSGISAEQLTDMLNAMRSDHLLAASLIGSLQGLRDVLANALTAHAKVQTKALGDAGDDVVYTPVTPCRLVDTRNAFAAVYQGAGAFTGGEIRNYAVQGGNGVCLSQLPGGLNPSAVQLQVFGILVNGGASGDVEILPQGSTFGSTATLVYLGNVLLTSASTTARINLANNQVGVQVRGGGANVAIDVVGYFKAPAATALDCTTIQNNGTLNPLSFNTIGADCPAGYKLTGGGCHWFNLDGSSATGNQVIVNHDTQKRDPTLGFLNGWSCRMTNNDLTTTFTMGTCSVCCRVPGQ